MPKRNTVKHPNPLLASKYFPSIDNLRPDHKSPSATSVTSKPTHTDDTQRRRPGQDDIRKTKVLKRRSAYRSSAAELIEASELTRTDFESHSSYDGNDTKETFPDHSVYNMPEMKGMPSSVLVCNNGSGLRENVFPVVGCNEVHLLRYIT